jgi:hypothetical protein
MFWRLFNIAFALEDRTLQQELEGYAQYTEITRYRLVPFEVIRKGLTYHTVNGWEARRPESWDAGSSNRF